MIQITFADEEIPMLIEACGELKLKYGLPLLQKIQAAQDRGSNRATIYAPRDEGDTLASIDQEEVDDKLPRPPRKPGPAKS